MKSFQKTSLAVVLSLAMVNAVANTTITIPTTLPTNNAPTMTVNTGGSTGGTSGTTTGTSTTTSGTSASTAGVDSETCAVAQATEENLAEMINEKANEGLLAGKLIENFKKSNIAKNCLVGFSNSLDLSGMIPAVKTDTFDGNFFKEKINESVKKVIAKQKEHLMKKTCAMADEALSGALAHIKDEMGKIQNRTNEALSGQALDGAINENVDRVNRKISSAIDEHILRLDDRLKDIQAEFENQDLLGGEIDRISDEIEDYANQATRNYDKPKTTVATTGGAVTTPAPTTANTNTGTTTAPTSTIPTTAPTSTIPTTTANTNTGTNTGTTPAPTTAPITTTAPTTNEMANKPKGY